MPVTLIGGLPALAPLVVFTSRGIANIPQLDPNQQGEIASVQQGPLTEPNGVTETTGRALSAVRQAGASRRLNIKA